MAPVVPLNQVNTANPSLPYVMIDGVRYVMRQPTTIEEPATHPPLSELPLTT